MCSSVCSKLCVGLIVEIVHQPGMTMAKIALGFCTAHRMFEAPHPSHTIPAFSLLLPRAPQPPQAPLPRSHSIVEAARDSPARYSLVGRWRASQRIRG